MRRAVGMLLLLLSLTAQAQSALESTEQQLLQACNQVRQSRGLPALVSSTYLQRAARSHSEEMLKLKYFDHESPFPERHYPWDRVAQAGADADSIAENIFESTGPLAAVPAAAVQAWVNSPAHMQNLIDPAKTNAGVGMASGNGRTEVTMVFSSPVSPIEH